MPLCKLVVATFENVSGIPRDRTVNTFHFNNVLGGAPDNSVIAGYVQSFYNDDATGVGRSPIAGYISGAVSRAALASKVQVYDVPAVRGPVGSPVFQASWTLGAKAGADKEMPAEVACCASYHAALTDVPEESGPTRPAARKRGRIYLGPLSIRATNNAEGSEPRPADNLVIQTVAQFTGNLMLATHQHQLAVFSRTAWATALVTGGFVDNAFDTQRRRGPKATGRTTF